MSKTYKSDIAALLRQCRIGFIATTGKNGPETSMAPYAIHHGNILFHLSRLARHSTNIANHAKAGFMICTPETEANSPLALPRLSLQGDITAVPEPELAHAKTSYLQSIPDAEPLFEFPDFKLFILTVSDIHWVGGFGSARTVLLNDWSDLLAESREETA